VRAEGLSRRRLDDSEIDRVEMIYVSVDSDVGLRIVLAAVHSPSRRSEQRRFTMVLNRYGETSARMAETGSFGRVGPLVRLHNDLQHDHGEPDQAAAEGGEQARAA
jgi:hypothetical protein